MILEKLKQIGSSLYNITTTKHSSNKLIYAFQVIEAEKALKLGNWDDYLNYNDKNNYLLDYMKLASELLESDNIELFQKIEQEAIDRKKLKENFYQTIMNNSMVHNSCKIVKYLYNKENINLLNVSADNLLTMKKNNAIELLNFFLYELKIYTPDEICLQIADAKNGYKYYQEIMNLFKTRDLYFKLNKELITNNQPQCTIKRNKV